MLEIFLSRKLVHNRSYMIMNVDRVISSWDEAFPSCFYLYAIYLYSIPDLK